MTEYVKAWQCIGCGRIESTQTCIGVCQDRKVQFVYAQEHEAALARLQMEHRKATLLENLVRQFAWTTPRNDEWEHSYRALQSRARRLLATLTRDAHDPDASESRHFPA